MNRAQALLRTTLFIYYIHDGPNPIKKNRAIMGELDGPKDDMACDAERSLISVNV